MWSMTVTQLARAIRDRDLSPVEVVEGHRRRAAEVNPRINAVVQLAPNALDEAAAAERALRERVNEREDEREDERPLLGVPFTVKDNLETAGIVTAIGVPERATTVPTRDASVVARLRRAGAVLLGKTNCPPWGAGIETDNPVYGRTNNPHDVTRTPGGSSGGEAAIVAAGGSPFGVGTDSGGSVRLPAHFCGVAAIKPTAGLVPVAGVVHDGGQIGSLSDPRTQVGLFARSVADLALLLGVVAGPDVDDAGVVPVPLGDPTAVRIGELRVGLVDDNGRHPPTPETVAAVNWAANTLAGADRGARRVRLPGDGHALTHDVWRTYGGGVTSAEVYDVLRRWDAYRALMARFMADLDVIVCPVYPTPAPRHGGTDGDAVSYTTPYSLIGAPCVVVPCGMSPEGLPIAVQVVAGPWQDHVALAAGQHLEAEWRRHTGGH
jgi:amidase